MSDIASVTSPVEQLHELIRRGHEEEAKSLCSDLTALINEKGQSAFTALHWSAACGLVSLTQYLIATGADVNAMNSNGDTPLHVATWKSQPQTVKLLLTQPALNSDIRNREGAEARDLIRDECVKQLFVEYELNKGRSMIKQHAEDDDNDDD